MTGFARSNLIFSFAFGRHAGLPFSTITERAIRKPTPGVLQKTRTWRRPNRDTLDLAKLELQLIMKTLADLQGLRDSMAPPRPRRHPDRRVSLAPAQTPGPSESLAPAQTPQPSETRLAPIVEPEPEPEPEWTPPLTILPAVRRKPVGPAAHPRTLAPPRTPRSSSGARGGAGAIDFIVVFRCYGT